MRHTTTRVEGIISRVYGKECVTKENQPQLVEPDKFYLTQVEIDRTETGLAYLQLIGEFDAKYQGRKITYLGSYEILKGNKRRFIQRVCIDDKFESEREVVKQI